MNSNDLKKVPYGVSVHEETQDHCTSCGQETEIANINLATGVCMRCCKGKKKLTIEQINELLKLDRGFRL